MTISEIMKVLKDIEVEDNRLINHIKTDTRKIEKDDIFIAIKSFYVNIKLIGELKWQMYRKRTFFLHF